MSTDPNNLTHYIGSIDADDFLIQLAKELECFPPELFLNPYTFLDKQLNVIQKYPLSDGLDVLSNLRGYLKEQSKTPLSESLYTAFIHKYPTKESALGLSDEAIDDVMWAYNKQARLLVDNVKFEQSIELYKKALKIQPDHVDILGNYGCALSDLAKLKKDEDLFNKAFEQYEKTLKIQPDHANNLGNYGNVLSDLAKLKKDEDLFNKAFEQYEKTSKIQPDHANNLDNYGCALVGLGKLKQDESLFKKAFEQLSKAFEIQPNETYNLACYYAIRNQFDLAKQYLLLAEQHNLKSDNLYIDLLQDDDFDNLRNEQWFMDLIERLKEKEIKDKVA